MGILVIQNIQHLNKIKGYLILTTDNYYTFDGDIVLLLECFLKKEYISETEALKLSKEAIQNYLDKS